MTNLRRQAIGRQCTIRLPGCQTEPVCLCHVRQIGISGMGIKAPNWAGAFGCAACHDKVDRTHRHDPEVQLDFYRAVIRTQKILVDEGVLPWAA
jgi:hypothetical protein